MRIPAFVCSVPLSVACWGCTVGDPAPADSSGAAGKAAAQTAGSGGSVATASGGSASGGSASGGSTSASGGGTSSSAGASGAAGSSGGGAGASGAAGSGGGSTAGTGGGGPAGDGSLGHGDQSGTGMSSEQYYTAADIKRNGQSYVLITNGWGPGFQSHTISWNGTAFTVEKMAGTAGSGGQPASYPSVFCGQYSVKERGDCGLPKAIADMTSLKTGWRWAPNGNEDGKYNAAYDIWVGDGTRFTGYYMVWLRDPPGYQPAGSPNSANQGVTVENVDGKWDIWSGTVNNLPIVNWVRHEGSDSHEIEFDVLDFLRDAQKRGIAIAGATHVRAVAVGFEIWEGPIAGLQSQDFYVKVN